MSTRLETDNDLILEEGRVRVWDRFVRTFHWSLAAGFFVAYFSEDELLTVHVWAGYVVGALVLMRIAWGFVGPRHARFSDFVCGPWKAWRYLMDLLSFRAERHLGHSPAGGLMVLALLAGLLATVWTGMELHAIENNAGPLAALSSPAAGAAAPLWVLRAAHADEGEHEAREHGAGSRGAGSRGAEEGLWEEAHEVLANLVLALVVLHVLGVLLASVVHRENLVRSMVTGFKPVD
jgi:cytochrome b